ncbi:GUN4 domain-containing protein [Nostoc sp. UHCC 0302]|uniref:GUN4 domain-containing protein n=1 Tax=Nostoc sp. UHCC 0302 TaxID=3134896 RepID=UPI00311C9CD0
MKLNYLFSATLVSVSFIVFHTASPVLSQQASNNFAQLQSLLEARKWYEANEETISLIRNDSANLSCPNLSSIDQLWVKHSNGKYGFTPQISIWQQVGGLNCKTCENQIKEFSKKVGWNLSQQVNPVPGDFVGQYPTVATLGWQSYVDSDRSLLNQGFFGQGTWQAWKIGNFNFFSTLKNCQGKTP